MTRTAASLALVLVAIAANAWALPSAPVGLLVGPAFAEEVGAAPAITAVDAVRPRRASNGGSCTDYTIKSYFTGKVAQSIRPRPPFVNRPAGIDECGLEELHRFCVDRINAYRSGAIKFKDGTDDPDVQAGLEPLIEVR